MISYLDIHNIQDCSKIKWALSEDSKNIISKEIVSNMGSHISNLNSPIEKDFFTIMSATLYYILTYFIYLNRLNTPNIQKFAYNYIENINVSLNLKLSFKTFIKKELYRKNLFMENITLNPNPTCSTYLNMYNIPAQYTYHHTFYSFKKPILSLSDERIILNIQKYCSDVINSYTILDDKILLELNEKLFVLCYHYLFQFKNALQSKVFKRVKKIFTGTQGKPITRIASMAALANGVKVSSFYHTGGFIPCNYPARPLIESSTCSEYYCYHSYHKQVLEDETQEAKLQSSTNFHILPTISSMKVVTTGKIRHITYPMLTLHFDNQIHDRLLTPTALYISLHYQIIKAILAKNIGLTLKLHRKDLANPLLNHHLSLLKNQFNTTFDIEYRPLDELVNSDYHTDAWACDNIDSGTIIEVLKTDKPVIFFGWHLHEAPKIEIFKTRAKLINVYFTNNNIPTFNTEELNTFLDKEEHCLDFRGTENFLNYNFRY